MPDIKRLREEIHTSNTEKGDGTRDMLFSSVNMGPWLIDWFSYLRAYFGRPNDHHILQETQVQEEDYAGHEWPRAYEQ